MLSALVSRAAFFLVHRAYQMSIQVDSMLPMHHYGKSLCTNFKVPESSYKNEVPVSCYWSWLSCRIGITALPKHARFLDMEQFIFNSHTEVDDEH